MQGYNIDSLGRVIAESSDESDSASSSGSESDSDSEPVPDKGSGVTQHAGDTGVLGTLALCMCTGHPADFSFTPGKVVLFLRTTCLFFTQGSTGIGST